MFVGNINKMLEACRNEVNATKNKKIQKALAMYEKELNQVDAKRFLDAILYSFVEKIIQNPDVTEEEAEVAFEEYFSSSTQELQIMKKSLVLDIKLNGLEEEINRVIEIPNVCTLSDLAYAVLVAFQAEGSHLFNVIYKKVSYSSDADDSAELYASETMVQNLNLRKGASLEVWYDFGDNYTFNIKVKDVKKNDSLPSEESYKILEGKGYGIWEDNHYPLDLYYSDKKAFKTYIEECGIEEDYFPIHETFDLKEDNEMYFPLIQRMKMSYEYPDEYEAAVNEVMA